VICLAGTGFFDNWAPVDTTKEPTKEEVVATPADLPSTADIAAPSVLSQGPPIEAMMDTKPSPLDEDMEEPMFVDPPYESAFTPEESATITAQAVVTPSLVAGDWKYPQSANPAWKVIAHSMNSNPRVKTYVFAGIDGPRKSGKTGMVLDSLTEEEIANGAQIWHVDFDLGGETTKAAHHDDKKDNIVVLNPWVIFKGQSRVPFDFPATYQNTMDILLYALEVGQAQEAYYEANGKMPNPYLKTLCFDGLDHWLNICETCMKIEDLDLGKDGIDVSGKSATTKIGRFNWNIRKNRYNSAMNNMQELCRMGVNVYGITGRKLSYDSNGNEIKGADVPAWLKDSERDFQQLISVDVEKVRDSDFNLTGEEVSTATLTANRTSLAAPKPVVLFVREQGGEGTWNGWDGLSDGSFRANEE
tara:strand:- start:2947 stop:4194 length:1248 start_codon:yes stop_codon:yes gene_type:complete